MGDFYPVPCEDWEHMSQELRHEDFRLHWLFRGESLRKVTDLDKSLQTSLDRVLTGFDLKLQHPLDVEVEMMRDFRRKYDGVDLQDVENDTLYCMSLMRHYGAPTRLLDWTYSPFVAAYFALEKWHPIDRPVLVVWCLSDNWCLNSFVETYPDLKTDLLEYRRVHDEKEITPSMLKQKNQLFETLFMKDGFDYVYPVNPFHLHTRLNVQQGVFLCPGSISTPLVKILMKLKDWESKSSIRKLYWEIKDKEKWLDALDELHRSNISRVSLFPGPDGFAHSLNYRLRHYDKLAEYRLAERRKRDKTDVH